MKNKIDRGHNWCYGIVKDKRYYIAEVYWDKNKNPMFYCNISMKEFIMDFWRIVKDLYYQIKYYHIIKWEHKK